MSGAGTSGTPEDDISGSAPGTGDGLSNLVLIEPLALFVPFYLHRLRSICILDYDWTNKLGAKRKPHYLFVTPRAGSP